MKVWNQVLMVTRIMPATVLQHLLCTKAFANIKSFILMRLEETLKGAGWRTTSGVQTVEPGFPRSCESTWLGAMVHGRPKGLLGWGGEGALLASIEEL